MKFSFPFNIDEIINHKTIGLNWFNQYKGLIQEVYTTPFWIVSYNDMNGPVPNYNKKDALNFLINLRKIGIEICVIFNNIFITYPEEVKNIQDWDFINTLTVPNKEWLVYKDTFKIKNTVVNTPSLSDVSSGLYDDYNIIQIHDDIIHNHDTWKEIKGKRLFSVVSNFSECFTFCKLKRIHYNKINQKDYYWSDTHCPAMKMSDLERKLKVCAIPYDYYEYNYYTDVIDLFKLQGRTQKSIFKDCIKLIELIDNKQTLSFISKFDYLKWKVRIRNCGGNCVTCKYCDTIISKYSKKTFQY